MRTYLLTLVLVVISLQGIAQSSAWSFLSPLRGDVNLFSISICKQKNGYAYLGGFTTQLELGQFLITNASGYGLFIAKYDTNGNPLSLLKIGSATLVSLGGYVFSFGLSSDTNGNTYVGIKFKDSIKIFNQTILGNSFVSTLILKLDKSDNLVWSKLIKSQSGSVNIGYDQSLQVNENQSFSLAITVADSTQIDSFWIEKARGLIVNFDSNGHANWIQTAGKNNIPGGYIGLNINRERDMYALGMFATANNILFDTIKVMAFDENYYTGFQVVSKYDTNGQIQWVRHFGGVTTGASFSSNSVKCDSKGNVYVSGSYFCQSSLDQIKIQGGGLFNAYGQDVFIIKYDKDGNFKWFKHTGYTDEEEWRGFDISENDEIYLAYIYHTKSKFETDSVLSKGGNDIALVKLDTSGNVVWVNNIGGQVMNKLLV